MTDFARRSFVCLTLVSVSAIACSRSEPRVTERDALAMGFAALNCSPIRGVPLYADPDSLVEAPDYCTAVEAALELSKKYADWWYLIDETTFVALHPVPASLAPVEQPAP